MLNEILKEKRKELDLTQQNVADHLNVTRQTVSSWEVGKSFPDISTLIKISDFYQLSLDYMLKGDVNLMKKIKKDTNDLKKYQNIKEILKIEYCEQIEPPVRMIEPASAINRATQCERESH